MRRQITWVTVGLSVLVAGAWVVPARATYHTFRINEIYSNASGSVQFIEMKEILGSDFENFVTMAPDIKSTTHDFIFPNDLPSTSTANKTFLLGTPGYTALVAPSAAPDYTIPANFFNPAGDTLTYGTTGPDGIVDMETFGPQPSDPSESLNRTGLFQITYEPGPATPTNFAGHTGSVPEPGGALALCATAGVAVLRRRGRR
jgi:hypothetical protein